MKNKRPAAHLVEINAKRAKPNEIAPLLLLKKQTEMLFDKYKNISVETFREKLIHQYKLFFLSDVLEALHDNNPSEQLKGVLSNIWHKFKNSIVCYTALPKDDITILACDIAQFISNEINVPALSILMPNIHLESIDDENPDLDGEEILIKEVIQTHVISQCGRSLVPVKILLGIDINRNISDKIKYPYNNLESVDLKEEDYFLGEETLTRLFSHSDVTCALHEAENSYRRISAKDQSLFAQLTKLCNELYLNSKDGFGSEENAGSGAYSAIIAFHNYYNQIDEQVIKTLPEALQEEINKIITFSSDKAINIDATETLDTCIATRRNYLSKAMLGHEMKLKQITLSSEKVITLIDDIENTFQKCKEELEHRLKNGYCGADNYPISKSLIYDLEVTPKISKLQDFMDLLSLAVDELNEIFDFRNELIAEISYVLDDMEKLVMFFINTPCEKLKLILFKIKDKLIVNDLITGIENIVSCLITLESEKLQIVAEFLLEDINTNRFLDEESCIGLILEPFSLEQRVIVFNEIKKTKLIDDISHIHELDFINYLPASESLSFLESKKHIWFSNIDANDLFSFIDVLTPEKRKEVFPFLKQNIEVGFFNGKSCFLGYYLESISLEHCTRLIKKQSNTWFMDIIANELLEKLFLFVSPQRREIIFSEFLSRVDLFSALGFSRALVLSKFLSINEFSLFLDQLQKAPRESFKIGYYYNSFVSDLGCDQKMKMFVDKTMYYINLGNIFKKVEDLFFIRHLDSEQCRAVMKKNGHIVENAEYFDRLTKCLPSEKKMIVFNEVKDYMDVSEVIKSLPFLACYLNSIDDSEGFYFLNTIADKLSNIINSTTNLDVFLEVLLPEKTRYVFDMVYKNIDFSDIVKKIEDLAFFKYLSLNECAVVLNHIKNNRVKIISLPHRLLFLFYGLDEDKCKIIFDFVQEDVDINHIITSVSDLQIIKCLPVEARLSILEKISWQTLIKKANNLVYLYHDEFENIGFDVRDSFFEFAIKKVNVIGLIKNIHDICCLSTLPISEFKNILEEIKENWSCLITRGHDLIRLLEEIYCPVLRKMIYTEAKKHIDVISLVKTGSDLCFINFLDAYNLDLLLEDIKSRWAEVFTTVESFISFISGLFPERRNIIFNQIKNNDFIIDIFKDFDSLYIAADSLTAEEYGIVFEKMTSKNMGVRHSLLYLSEHAMVNNESEENKVDPEKTQHSMQF